MRGRAAARVNAAAHPLGVALEALRRKLGAGTVRTWIEPVTVEAAGLGRLVLGAPSRFIRDWLDQKLEMDIRSAWNRTLPRGAKPVDRVEFVVRK